MSYISYYRPPFLREMIGEALGQINAAKPSDIERISYDITALSSSLKRPFTFNGDAVNVLESPSHSLSQEEQKELARYLGKYSSQNYLIPDMRPRSLPDYLLYHAIFGMAPKGIDKRLQHNPIRILQRGLAPYHPRWENVNEIQARQSHVLERLSPKDHSFVEKIFKESVWGSEILLRGGFHWKNLDYLFDEDLLKKMSQDPKVSSKDKNLVKMPSIQSLQQTERIFRKLGQSYLKDGVVIGSLPAGGLRAALGLNYSRIRDVDIVGIDTDQQALAGMALYARSKDFPKDSVQFSLRDGLMIGARNCFDLFFSLNFSTSLDDKNRRKFFKQLFLALKPGGIGILNYPNQRPDDGTSCEWNKDAIQNIKLLEWENLIFKEIINPEWSLNHRNSNLIIAQLKAAGFQIIHREWDSAQMSPTFIVKRPA